MSEDGISGDPGDEGREHGHVVYRVDGHSARAVLRADGRWEVEGDPLHAPQIIRELGLEDASLWDGPEYMPPGGARLAQLTRQLNNRELSAELRMPAAEDGGVEY